MCLCVCVCAWLPTAACQLRAELRARAGAKVALRMLLLLLLVLHPSHTTDSPEGVRVTTYDTHWHTSKLEGSRRSPQCTKKIAWVGEEGPTRHSKSHKFGGIRFCDDD